MAIKSGVGFASGEDSYVVGANACQSAIANLEGVPSNLVIVFASVVYDQEKMLAGVRSVSKEALLVGASTAGEITTDGPQKAHGVAVMALASDSVNFFADVGLNIAQSAHDAGKAAANAVKAAAKDPLKAFIMFPDVLVGNGAETVRGVLESLGEHFPVVGGASGDDFKFEKTYQYLNDKVYSGAVVGLGLTGDVTFGVGVKHGWIPIGVPMKVTKSEGSVLHELDGKPAIQIYEDYLGVAESASLRSEPLARVAITYPLGMKVAGSDELLIRDPITVDAKGSITCAAEIPEGSEIRLMVGSHEEAVRVAKIAAEDAIVGLNGKSPAAVLIFNCIARSKLFGERSGEEIDAIQSAIGREVPLLGFYTYGEQAPLGGEVRNIEKCNPAFHNETVVIFVLGQ